MKRYDLRNNKKLIIDDFLKTREQTSYEEYEQSVSQILDTVKNKGNAALIKYSEQFDQVKLTQETLFVSEAEIKEAYKQVDTDLIRVIKRAYEKIYSYHMKQKKYSWFDTDAFGTMLGQKISPIERVGVYVPGGTAVYPSSVLMNVIPALVAGVADITMTTPMLKNGQINPTTLVAADICGIKKILKVGGAQAIGALAYGTQTIQKVDKIVGPGNIYVALAKKKVFGQVGIDSIAGPSEILIIADETAKAKYVAADMLSQAEHDVLASSVLVTTSAQLADDVSRELEQQAKALSRTQIMLESLKNYGAIILVNSLEDAIHISDQIAPEHLEICTKEPVMVMNKINHAGAIFLGNYSPEPLGDYMAGPNHVLPTNATARFFSPLSVDDFIKKSSIIYYNEEALATLKEDIVTFAENEALTAHANAIKVRFLDE
ncbi:histidinol dehydrogenase [Vallitaleaceae bacterium 9-2]